MANKIIHKHSSVIENRKAKLPSAEQLDYGELAVNYADGVETITIKNTANEIVEFKSNEYYNKEISNLDGEIDALKTQVGGKASSTHTHGKITLSGDVSGNATIGSGTTAINITTTVADNSHNHTSANITDSVASGVTSGTTTLAQGRAIVDYAAPKAHTHVSAGITDSISAASSITSGATALTQGKAIYNYAAPKTHNHGTITLTGDVTGSGTITGSDEIKITATVANDSHSHSNYTTNTNFNAHTATSGTTGATGHVKLVTGDLSGATYANGQAAAAAHTHGQYANKSDFNTHSGTTGTSGVTGHVKLVTGNLNGKKYANGEAAAAAHTHDNYSVTGHKHVSADITDTISKASGITSGATALTQGKAVYDYAAPKSHSHSNYSVTGHTHSQYTTNTDFNAHTATSGTTGATGHVKLVTGNLNGKQYTSGEAAAAAHTHDQYATASNFNTHSGTTGTSGTTGHVKLVTGDLSGKKYANGEAAAAAHTHDNYSVTGHKHVSADITDTISKASGITSGATALTQGKAVYDYAAPKSHSHSNYSVTGHTHSQYATNNDLTAATTRITKLEGNDAGKSIRTVATEEVAKVIAEAPESYDTLKEIADWISNDTTGAASMANDITELKGTVSGFTSSATIKQTTDALTTAVNSKAPSTHSHGTITLTGDVTGSASIGSGTTAIKITATVADDSHNHTSIKNNGNLTALTGTSVGNKNTLQLNTIYNNGYPIPYGNLLRIGGIGFGELACEWSGTHSETPPTGRMYYRSKRDNDTTPWSDWKTVAWTSDIPTTLKNPNAIKFKNTSGTTITYDGSSTIDLTGGINYAASAASATTAASATNASKLENWSKTDIQINPNSNGHILFDTTPMIINGVNLGTNCTLVTAPDNNAPFQKVWLSTGYTSWYSASNKLIYVTPGDTIYVESWIMRKSGATGTAGLYYLGLQFTDKNGKVVNDNAGTVYMTNMSAYTCPTDGVWHRQFAEYKIPKTHTAYNGSDAGAYYRAQVRLLINHDKGTIPTYFGGFRIYKRIMAKTDETGGIKVAGTRSSAITTTQGGTGSTRYYGVEIDSNGKAFVNVPWTDTNTKVTSVDNHYKGSLGAKSSGLYKVAFDAAGHITGATAVAKSDITALGIPGSDTNTDTKVTSVDNHYAPTENTGSTLSANATGATAAWSIDVVKGVTIKRDAKGHVTGVSVTSGKLPANPNTDTKNTAGSTNSASKLYLVGATSQAANPQTYSNSKVYATDGALVADTFSGAIKGSDLLNVNKGYSDLNFKFYNNLSGCDAVNGVRYAGTENTYGFPVSNNANSMLWLGGHSGNYGHQLGFSSDGRIYARYISNGTFPTTANGASWFKLAYTSDIPSVTAATTAEIQALF